MPVTGTQGSGGSGVAFLVSWGIVAEIIAKACSSPQTAEINIGRRESTLMKWVYIGEAEAVLVVAIAAIIDRRHRVAILAGGGISLAVTHGQYVHARQAGLAAGGAGTED